MALLDFWISVRTASRLMMPLGVVADTPRFDPASFEAQLRKARHWLSLSAVAGFDAAEFDFLPEVDRTKLAKLVADFRQVASTVGPKAPVTEKAVEQAAPLFRDIVQILGFDRYEDAEAYRLGKQIEGEIEGDRPAELEELRFKTGLDQTGDPAVWVLAILKDVASESDDQFLENAHQLRPLLKAAARKVAPDRWPYLSFRSLAEQLELAETPGVSTPTSSSKQRHLPRPIPGVPSRRIFGEPTRPPTTRYFIC